MRPGGPGPTLICADAAGEDSPQNGAIGLSAETHVSLCAQAELVWLAAGGSYQIEQEVVSCLMGPQIETPNAALSSRRSANKVCNLFPVRLELACVSLLTRKHRRAPVARLSILA